jgi:hypothetical protein
VDSASVKEQKEGNFAFGLDGDDNKLRSIVDPFTVFSYDNSLTTPNNFINMSLEELLNLDQLRENELPSAFFAQEKILFPNEVMVFNEIIGHVNDESELVNYSNKKLDSIYFILKEQEADTLVKELSKTIETETAIENFDKYAKYTYMDNVLRGGVPTLLADQKPFYVYSRKHGDLERDYNYFSMSAKNYSQGNGNYRDVNQNRRCDNFFNPIIKDENIKLFYNLIQVDGYNPLVVKKQTYSLNNDIDIDAKIKEVVKGEFTPGDVSECLNNIEGINKNDTMNYIFANSSASTNYAFQEGYWSDHFTYNLDLIEEYLNIYPDQEKKLLLDDSYKFSAVSAKVNNRSTRYVITDKGIRQYNSVKEVENPNKWQLTNGKELKSTLIQKLILISAVKFSTLDPSGFGIEMEGGKPGWYDALNGLPGIFGSSMNETYELLRNVKFTINALSKLEVDINLMSPLYKLLTELSEIIINQKSEIDNSLSLFEFWDKISVARENYREEVYDKEIDTVLVSRLQIINILKAFKKVLTIRIDFAVNFNRDVIPSYFYYDVIDYTKYPEIVVNDFKINKVANFLEGSVHYLKLIENKKEIDKVYSDVRKSDLYDKELNMYKVNGSLKSMTFEIGRCKSFSPGWLENESIWLHMEYKYLLETLKSGQYENFFKDFSDMAVCFLDDKVYGRSILENSSFIASSANSNKKIHGRGFVARLSGSTAEFLSIYKQMMFGDNIFKYFNSELYFELTPSIPAYLIKDNHHISTTLLSSIEIDYKFSKKADIIPEKYKISKYILTQNNNQEIIVNAPSIKGDIALAIRNLEFKKIVVEVEVD